MTKLHFIKEALFELLGNRVDFLKEKFIKDYLKQDAEGALRAYPNLDKDTVHANQVREANGLFLDFEQADPTKNKQYLQWLIKQFFNNWYVLDTNTGNNIFVEDLPKITTRLEIFHDLGVHRKLQGKDKDINQYNIDSLKELTEPYMKSESDLTQDEQDVINEQAEKIWDGEEWAVYVPKTELSACVLGKDTDWCTTYGYEGGRYPNRSGNQFDNYNSQGNLYILVNKKNGEKLQFHFPSYQFMDSGDNQINLEELIGENPEIEKALESRLPVLRKESIEALNSRIRSDQIGNWVDNEQYQDGQDYKYFLKDIIDDVYRKYAEQNNLDPVELDKFLTDKGVTKKLSEIDVEPDEVNYNTIYQFIDKLKAKLKKTDSITELVNLLSEAPSSNNDYWYESPLYYAVSGAVYDANRKPIERAVVKEFNTLMRNNKQYLQREQKGQTNLFEIKAILKKLLS